MVQQSEHSQIRALIWVHIVYWAHFSATRINKLIKLKVWFHPLTLSTPIFLTILIPYEYLWLKCSNILCDLNYVCIDPKTNVCSWAIYRPIKYTLIRQLPESCLIWIYLVCKRRLKSLPGLNQLCPAKHTV